MSTDEEEEAELSTKAKLTGGLASGMALAKAGGSKKKMDAKAKERERKKRKKDLLDEHVVSNTDILVA